MHLQNEALQEAAILDRLKQALKDKRLVIIVGAGVTLSVTSDISRQPLPCLIWTDLVRNGLDYLVNEGMWMPLIGRQGAYESLGDDDPDSLLDAANVMVGQMHQNGQFPA
jgi:hypothetical protein